MAQHQCSAPRLTHSQVCDLLAALSAPPMCCICGSRSPPHTCSVSLQLPLAGLCLLQNHRHPRFLRLCCRHLSLQPLPPHQQLCQLQARKPGQVKSIKKSHHNSSEHVAWSEPSMWPLLCRTFPASTVQGRGREQTAGTASASHRGSSSGSGKRQLP